MAAAAAASSSSSPPPPLEHTPRVNETPAQNETPTPLAAPPPVAQITLGQHQTTTAPPPGFAPYMYADGYGQPFVPYADQSPLDPLPMPINKAWEITKLVLHGLGIVFSAIVLGLGLSLLKQNLVYIAVGVCPGVGAALIWSIAEFITRAVRKFKAGIHPGAHVGVCLILWLSNSILTVVFGVLLGVANIDQENLQCSYAYDSRYQSYRESCDSDPISSDVWNISIAASAFGCAITIIYFILFVGACVDTHKRNKSAARPILVLAQPQHWPTMTQGWHPMPTAAAAGVGEPKGPMGQVVPMQQMAPSAGQGRGPAARGHDIVEHYAPGDSVA